MRLGWKTDRATEMKLTIAAIYTNFTTHITEMYGDEGIEQEDGYTTAPKGRKLMLQFKIVEDQRRQLDR